jgi:hypothetical protein
MNENCVAHLLPLSREIVRRTYQVIIVSMPSVIDYPEVLERLRSQGLISLYHNSGAFGFPREVQTNFIGWIGSEDTTLRAEARVAAISIAQPCALNLATLVTKVRREQLSDSVAWLMPMSHWSYELDYGSADWMPQMLRGAGIDPEVLRPRANGSAIEFTIEESEQLAKCVERLLENLASSDFAILFPPHPIVCTIHHHKQLWWTSSDFSLIEKLRAIARSQTPPVRD